MKTTTKTAFVLSLPIDLPASEVIERAKALGLALTDAYVYSIRSKDRARDGAPRRKRGRPVGSTNKPRGDALEAQFLGLAIDLGLQRSQTLLGSLRSVVAA